MATHPHRWYRFASLRRWGALLALATLALSLAAAPRPALAGGLVVNTLDDDNQQNNNCTLREAILAAQTDQTVDGCTGASGNDIIRFSLSGTITLKPTLGPLIIPDGRVGTSMLKIDGENKVSISGGGQTQVFIVHPAKASITLSNLTVKNGKANQGGAIHNAAALKTENVTFSDNIASVAGGAIFNDGGILYITNSTFSHNRTDGNGGAIANVRLLYIQKSTFSENNALNGGAVWSIGPIDIGGSTFARNKAVGNSQTAGIDSTGGGAVWSNNVVSIGDSTFSGNTANQGGGLLIASPKKWRWFIRSTTFAYNQANQGAHLAITVGGRITLRHSILAYGTGSACVDSARGIRHWGGNLIDDDTCGIPKGPDPKLGELRNNGGSTLTYMISKDSPAVDGGKGACNQEQDQRGIFRRNQDGNGDGVAKCDIGAVERQTKEP